ncbi:hypothetical protein Acid345_3384 [Candidatus Koribacter versatilis Ellin345]|uniref:Uncharacterized protein n=1 Tax=Koribacter versatilis (strain Ellin345) TaxID=204669 RepID=Q1IL65_KORVE|nr:hypothetical protein [Candidatus Koribacter versatilis]ABF42385.1 hypothetical protein Acid345_3384 [Candidatus Koribacter versatilis Ellin345]
MAACRKCRENGCFKCEAQEGIDLCPLCEDGVFCPEQKRVAKLAAEKPAVRRDVYQPGSTRIELDQPVSARTRRIRERQAEPIAEDAPIEFSMCSGDANKFIEQGGAKLVHAVVKLVKERREKQIMSDLVCKFDGCTKGLTSRNRTGFCSKHWYYSTLPSANATPPRKSPAKHAAKNGNGHAEPPKDERPLTNVATFCLTEAQMDRLFLGSTFEAKVFALQTIIEQEQQA